MDFSFIAILLLAFGAMWLMTRKSRQQQKAAAELRSNLSPGQEVMTVGGLFGTVVALDDETVTLETSPGVTSRWLRRAVGEVVVPPVAEDDADDELEDELDDDELEDELDDDLADDELDEGLDEDDLADEDLEVPDDASSLTDGTDPDGTTRR